MCVRKSHIVPLRTMESKARGLLLRRLGAEIDASAASRAAPTPRGTPRPSDPAPKGFFSLQAADQAKRRRAMQRDQRSLGLGPPHQPSASYDYPYQTNRARLFVGDTRANPWNPGRERDALPPYARYGMLQSSNAVIGSSRSRHGSGDDGGGIGSSNSTGLHGYHPQLAWRGDLEVLQGWDGRHPIGGFHPMAHQHARQRPSSAAAVLHGQNDQGALLNDPERGGGNERFCGSFLSRSPGTPRTPRTPRTDDEYVRLPCGIWVPRSETVDNARRWRLAWSDFPSRMPMHRSLRQPTPYRYIQPPPSALTAFPSRDRMQRPTAGHPPREKSMPRWAYHSNVDERMYVC